MASVLKLFIILLIFLYSSNPCKSSNDNSFKLDVDSPTFKDLLNLAMSILQNTTSTVSNFQNIVKDFRLSNILSDCAKLLDSTQEVLDWSLTKFQNPHDFGTSNLKFDLQTWLSAAITSIATCNDELVGTNMSIILKESIVMSLEKVTTLVSNQLASVQQLLNETVDDGFQSWFTSLDWKPMQASEISVNITVASNGSGDYKTIMDAVKVAPSQSSERFVIYIKKGIYREYVSIPSDKWNMMMVGDGIDQTIISGNRSNTTGWKTYGSATFGVDGKNFIAVNMTFENTAGPEEGQAVALRSDSDYSIFYRCGIRGYQDSLYAHKNRQFYRECQIKGTVDFIFGDATAVFQKCDILPRQASPGQSNTITAQGREQVNAASGFSFHMCTISGDSDLISSNNPTPTYLGRPWMTYSRTVFLQSYMSNIIRPEGWLRWNPAFESTLFYGEYNNTGPGANTDKRVKWPGVHILDSTQAQNYTVDQFLLGNTWLPSTGIPFDGGLVG
ncbi:pectinesterase/pectinesterase inhibitor ppe8b [Quercus suber]|uniref:Pectinesterase n=2 Tax=Quercus suber TaxID=58331 RepID=A0AAW0JGL0_QUESU|nr:pectinesterase/pectinesterase inhibitor ppe8b [Quercus suber]